MIMPEKLQKKGNLVLVHSFADAYEQDELIEYLERLKETQKRASPIRGWHSD